MTSPGSTLSSPRSSKPFEATLRSHASVPAITFGDLTHSSANTLWDVRAGRFVYDREDDPSTGNRTTAGRFDQLTNVSSGAPQTFGGSNIIRTTAKATVSRFRPGLWGADHQWKMGGQFDRGDHHVLLGHSDGCQVRRQWRTAVSVRLARALTRRRRLPHRLRVRGRHHHEGGLTISAGLRFDHSRAIIQDLHALDLEGRETDQIVKGLGTLYTWNVFSPRLGVTTKLTADGRTVLRASYGMFRQGLLTGEFAAIHPAATATTTAAFNAATGGYTTIVKVDDPASTCKSIRRRRSPRSEEYSIGLDREVGRKLAVAIA